MKKIGKLYPLEISEEPQQEISIDINQYYWTTSQVKQQKYNCSDNRLVY